MTGNCSILRVNKRIHATSLRRLLAVYPFVLVTCWKERFELFSASFDIHRPYWLAHGVDKGPAAAFKHYSLSLSSGPDPEENGLNSDVVQIMIIGAAQWRRFCKRIVTTERLYEENRPVRELQIQGTFCAQFPTLEHNKVIQETLLSALETNFTTCTFLEQLTNIKPHAHCGRSMPSDGQTRMTIFFILSFSTSCIPRAKAKTVVRPSMQPNRA